MIKGDRETVAINKSQGTEHFIPCERCSIETSHKVLASADVAGTWTAPGIDYWEQYQVVQCQGCKSISFRKNTQNTEDLTYVEMGDGTEEPELADHEEVFPSRIAGRQKIKRSWLLPATLVRIYHETHAALNNKLTILAGIGIRSLIEAICKEKKASGRDLKLRINDLVTKGVLTQAGADILHQLRELGNESVHEIKPHDEASLDLAMDVVENSLQNVFVLTEAARLMKENSKNKS